MTKPICWIPLMQWMAPTLEQHRNLEAYCRTIGYELGIDLIGDRAAQEQADFQKDRDDYTDEMSLGGRPYRSR